MNTILPVPAPEGYQEPLVAPPPPPPDLDPNTPLAIPVALDSKTAANLKLAFAAEARSNDRYHYFATIAEKHKDANAAAYFKKIAEDKHMFAQGHIKEAILGGLGDPDTGKPSAHITQVLETAIASEMQASAEMYIKYADEARVKKLPHLAEWFTELSRRAASHKKSFEDLLRYYDSDPSKFYDSDLPNPELRADW
jgi:rubrerythrin